MRRACQDCGELFDGERWQRLCWDCWRAKKNQVEDDGYSRGFDAGFDRGLEAGRAGVAPTIDVELLRRAILLCHPDRHAPERFAEANAVTADLLALRKELAA